MSSRHLCTALAPLAALSLASFGSEAAAVPTPPAVTPAVNGLSTSSQAKGPTDRAEVVSAAWDSGGIMSPLRNGYRAGPGR